MSKDTAARVSALVLATLLLASLTPYTATALNDTVTRVIVSDKDTYIYEAYPDTNFNFKDFIAAGHSAYSDKRIRALIYFNLASIPVYAEIVSARLVLTLKAKYSFEKSYQFFWIFRLARYWSEDGATWKNATASSLWAHAGGDYVLDGPGTYGSYGFFKVYLSDPIGKKYEVDVTELVKRYVNGGLKNYGILLMGSQLNGTVNFYDAEASNPGLRPQLVVTYRLPRIVLRASSYTAGVKQGAGAIYTLTADYQAIDESTIKLESVQPFHPSIRVYARILSRSPEKSVLEVKAFTAPDTPPGVYYAKLRVSAKSRYGGRLVYSSTITLRLAVTASGSFALSANPSTVSVEAGGNVTVGVKAQPVGSFTGTVSLSVADKPQGFDVELLNQSIRPGETAFVAVSVAPSVPPGNYTVTIEGSSDGIRQRATLSFTVTRPPLDYRLGVEPETLSLKRGETGTVEVVLQAVSGGAEDVQLSLHGLPGDASYSFSANPASPGDRVTLSITAGRAAGNYTLVVRAVSASGVERTAIIHLEVREEKLSFSLAVEPATLELNQGESGSVQVRVEKLGGGDGTVELSVSGTPPGATVTISPQSLTPPGYATLMVNAGSAKGTYTLVVEARSGDTVKTALVTLKVNEKRCIVATATYGSELSPEVSFLRRFRDTRVLATYSGVRFYAAFDAFYYSWSPSVAQFMHENPWTVPPMRAVLYPLILGLHAAYAASQPLLEVNTEAGVYLAGFLSAAAIGAVYLTPLAAATLLLARRLGRGFDPARAATVLAATLPVFLLASAASAALHLDAALTASTSGFVLATALASPLAVLALLGWAAPRVRGIIRRRVF